MEKSVQRRPGLGDLSRAQEPHRFFRGYAGVGGQLRSDAARLLELAHGAVGLIATNERIEELEAHGEVRRGECDDFTQFADATHPLPTNRPCRAPPTRTRREDCAGRGGEGRRASCGHRQAVK